ncbi:hypothetical protein AX774_g1253 [Zancudomyces culisetae]|uniref:Uncharacterized protein n=1 Tax=Zancudomyces culisetae TaxID=1213189 RepID=A0A1R1PWC2_ZANCU|nr:hypothetical protein AX774_g1253 [Zancudomyces culisetae]|eukprot:OMH85192.1 hypothetical protein AX774_g1253 [Zancudomyces culisetae]
MKVILFALVLFFSGVIVESTLSCNKKGDNDELELTFGPTNANSKLELNCGNNKGCTLKTGGGFCGAEDPTVKVNQTDNSFCAVNLKKNPGPGPGPNNPSTVPLNSGIKTTYAQSTYALLALLFLGLHLLG